MIALRIERMRVTCGLSAKEVAAGLGLLPSAYSKKVRVRDASFTLEELGRVADYVSGKTGRLLQGWPLIDEGLSALLEPRH
jgi:transcriptional regulator with XRE-family HTH domain